MGGARLIRLEETGSPPASLHIWSLGCQDRKENHGIQKWPVGWGLERLSFQPLVTEGTHLAANVGQNMVADPPNPTEYCGETQQFP